MNTQTEDSGTRQRAKRRSPEEMVAHYLALAAKAQQAGERQALREAWKDKTAGLRLWAIMTNPQIGEADRIVRIADYVYYGLVTDFGDVIMQPISLQDWADWDTPGNAEYKSGIDHIVRLVRDTEAPDVSPYVSDPGDIWDQFEESS